MPKSIAQMTAQVEKLQRQIDAAKAKEVEGVVDRIREAIDFYGLTPDQLFSPRAGRRKAVRSAREANGTQPVAARQGDVGKAGVVKLPPKYSDGAGNQWTGRGSTPRWLQEAIAQGKAKEDFLIGDPR